MKITRETLLKIIQEEYAAVHELGPATGHEPGTAPLKALQEIIAALAEVAGIMKDSPSDRPADEFAGYLKSISEELQAIFDEFHDIAKRTGHLDLPEGKGSNTVSLSARLKRLEESLY